MRSVRHLGSGLTFGILAFAALDAVFATVQAAQPGRLSGASIHELINGATVHMHTPVGTVVPVTYAEDGTVSGKTSGMVAYYLGGAQDRGRWWIKGRRLCQKWNTWFNGETKCIEIRRQGRKFHWKDRNGKTGVATIASRPNTVVAKRKTKKAFEKPYSLGVAIEPAEELAPAAVAQTPTRTVTARAVTKPRRQVAKPSRAVPAPRRVTFQTPPPLPVRPFTRHALVKTSSWAMRAH